MIAQAKPFPTFARGYARNRAQSAFPNLWHRLEGAWCPSLGPQGVTLKNLATSQNQGTLTNFSATPPYVVGQRGWTLDYDGVNDNVDCGNVLPASSTHFTISAWVKNDVLTTDHVIVSRCINGASLTNGLLLFGDDVHSGSGRTDCYALVINSGGTSESIATASGTKTTQLTHVVATFARGAAKIYLNGVLDPNFATLTHTNIGTGLANFKIGRRSDQGTYADGHIGDVLVWSRELSAGEVQLIYSGASPLTRSLRQLGKNFGTSLTLTISDAITLSESRKSQPNVAKVDSIAMSEAIARAIGVAKTDSVTLSESRSMAVSFRVTDSVTVTSSSSGVVGVPTAWNISLLLNPTPSTSAMVFPTTSSTFSAAPTSSNFQV